jgi:hypothetical protein
MKRLFLVSLISLLLVVAISPGFTQTLGDWTSLTSLPSPRCSCVAVLVDTTVYIVGGSEFSSDTSYPVLRTGILPDGTLSGWVEESCRPLEIRSESIIFANAGYLYAISGRNGPDLDTSTTIEKAKINADGSIGTWSYCGRSPASGFWESTWLQTSTDLYVIGNFSGSGEVWRLPLYTNGSIGTWSLLSSHLNYPRYGAAVTLIDNYIYVQGGIGSYTLADYAEYSQIAPDGSLGDWKVLTKPLAEHFTHLLVKIGARLYSISGCYPSWPDTEIESAEILSDYTLGKWVGLSPYPKPRRFFAHIQTGKGLYVFGGRMDSDMSSVQYAPIIPPTPSNVKSNVWKKYE